MKICFHALQSRDILKRDLLICTLIFLRRTAVEAAQKPAAIKHLTLLTTNLPPNEEDCSDHERKKNNGQPCRRIRFLCILARHVLLLGSFNDSLVVRRVRWTGDCVEFLFQFFSLSARGRAYFLEVGLQGRILEYARYLVSLELERLDVAADWLSILLNRKSAFVNSLDLLDHEGQFHLGRLGSPNHQQRR